MIARRFLPEDVDGSLAIAGAGPGAAVGAGAGASTGAAVGATGDYLERAEALVAQEVDVLLLDVAHADAEVVEHAIKRLRERFVRVPLVVGNVAIVARGWRPERACRSCRRCASAFSRPRAACP